MRVAIFSDVHANLEALEAVLTDAHEHKCTHFVCLGDVVGNNLDAAASFTYQHTTVCFFGHTHVPMVFIRDDNGVRQERTEHLRIEMTKKYFINTGSVGQPRDGNWRAAYCVYDIDNHIVEQLRAKYDLATAQKKIIKAGLPQLLAERLAIGR